MAAGVLKFGKRAVPVENRGRMAGNRERFDTKVRELADDLDFRRRWRKVSRIELWSDAAIFQLDDGTKWYLNIS